MDMDTFHNRSVLDSAPSISKVYLWGVFDFQKHHFNSLQAWRCRYSWAMIMVSVDLFIANGTLVINHNKPPRPDRPTLIPWEPPLSVPFLDPQTERIGRKEYHGNAFPEVTQSHGLETWFNAFNILVPPHGRVPLEAFGDPGQSWRILEALNFDRALLSAQILNIENRINIEDMQSEGLEPLNAVLINNNNAKRLFQNPTSTYLLVGILICGQPEDGGDEELGNEDIDRQDMNRQDVGCQDGDSPDMDSQDMDSQDAGSEDTLKGGERSEIEGTGRPVSTA
ncbi:uncharacterized protein BDZ83DRAFT_649421 [Colletotrichum acutatum]|uniref:Uncharacterized protein n=1 Tax=Glomerella acutata TaxID=27357 RepID=A0AAD8UQC5_GLOAC|nr:uncharacterized protein BDZ83DRAFT_649421 [Colletotrichum acutatum]KAK1727548.1 hypothetical protein BDZ83DRAFT_649421 [Colletotrichum acutatum]